MESALDLDSQAATNKINIINQIYTALIDMAQNVIRSTERTTIGICGLLIIFNGWIFRVEDGIRWFERVYLSAGSTIFGLLGLFIIILLHRRFVDLIKRIRRVNCAVMAYTNDVYLKDEPLVVHDSTNKDSNPVVRRFLAITEEPIFTISYVAIFATSCFAIFMIWSL